jgi:hypothetical protein
VILALWIVGASGSSARVPAPTMESGRGR